MENEKEITTAKKHNLLYRVFMSTKTSIVLFGCLFFFFLIGCVLPYHGDYNNIIVKGFLFNVIKTFDLLNVYSGPWFLTVAALFLINISVCSYHRLMYIIRGRRPKSLNASSVSARKNAAKLSLPVSVDDVADKLHKFFRPRLFRKIPVNTEGENTTGGFYEKGILHPIWISLIYHFAIILILVGCTITLLFSFEGGDVTIYDDKPVEIPTISNETTWYSIFGGDPETFVVPSDKKFEVGLKKFEVKYTAKPRVKDYPRKGLKKRIREILKDGGVSLYTKEDSYYPVEYSSHLVIRDTGETDKEVQLKVNTPLRYRGITFYQAAYDYRFDLLANGEEVEVSEEGKFKLPGIDGEFEQGRIIAGKFVEMDGSVSPIHSFVKVNYTPPAKDEKASSPGKGEEFKILEGVEQEIKGVTLKIENLRAGTILSYRHDPGLKPLWIGAPIAFFAMLFRAWGRWYRVSYVIEKTAEGANLYLHIHRTGIWGFEESILNKLQNALTPHHGT